MNTAFLIEDHKGAHNLELTGLGRINVFCGKNNSGKTTIVESIGTKGKHSPGLELTNQDKKDITNLCLAKYSEVTDRRNIGILDTESSREFQRASNAYANRLRNALESVFENTVTYLSIIKAMTSKTRQLGQEADRRVIKDALNNFRHELNRQLTQRIPNPTSFYIPAERRISSCNTDVKYNIALSNSGDNIISCIHNLCNSRPDSEDHRYLEELNQAFHIVTGGYSFRTEIVNRNSNDFIDLIFNSDSSSEWLTYRSMGRGLRDTLIILYHYIVNECEWLLIDEIEAHIHPEMQRRLANYLKDNGDKCVLITTHSSVFLSPVFADKVYCCRIADDDISVTEVTSRTEVLSNLGYSPADNLLADAVVLVEGPSDSAFYEEFFAKAGLYPKYNIRFWPIGGDTMYHSDLSLFADTENTMAIIDKDPKSSKARRKFMQECESLGIPCIRLSDGYAIENYIPLDSYLNVFKGQIDQGISRLDKRKKVEKQIGFNPKRSLRKLANETDLEHFMDTDLSDAIDALKPILGLA